MAYSRMIIMNLQLYRFLYMSMNHAIRFRDCFNAENSDTIIHSMTYEHFMIMKKKHMVL